jgi:exosome complex protein LRP1
MAGETGKLKTRLAALNTSLSDLESLLEPSLAQSLPETLSSLDPMQQAKFQTVLPYVIYDLIFSEPRPRTVVCVIKSIQYI